MRRRLVGLNETRARLADWRDDQSGCGYGIGCAIVLGLVLLSLLALTMPAIASMGSHPGPPEPVAILVERDRAYEAWIRNAFIGLGLSAAVTVWWLIGARPRR
jgi:hypothetical protein